MTAFSLEKIIRPNILKLQPYRCARDDYSAGILLDANENSYPPSLSASSSSKKLNGHSSTESELSEQSSEYSVLSLNRYPDPVQKEIKDAFASYRGFKHGSAGTFIGVGSDEIIDLLIRITCVPGEAKGDAILVCLPTYGMYSVCAAVNDVRVIKCNLIVEGKGKEQFQPDVKAINEILSGEGADKIKLLFLTSPGNPTGTSIPPETVQAILDHPTWRGLVVVDEAYIDFTGIESAVALFEKGYENLVVMQTLSKGFGLAGIRVGVSFQSPDLAQILANTKAPYSIGTPTASIALKALSPSNLALMETKATTLRKNRDWLLDALASNFPDEIGPSLGGNDANFVLVPIYARRSGESGSEKKLDNVRALTLYKKLAEEKGVVVRFRGNEHGCEACLRITVGTEKECEAVIANLRQVLDEA